MEDNNQEYDDQEAASEMKAKANFMNEVEPVKQYKKRRKLKYMVALVVVVLIAGVSFYFLNKTDTPADTSTNNPVDVVEVSKKTISTEVERHTSSQFFLSFEHPSDWEVEDESRTGELTATSPIIDIPSGDSTVSGKVVLYIKNNSRKFEEFTAGNATAVMDSDKIKYLKPSSAQRGETYISFLSFADSNSSSLINGVYVSGDFGYQKDQAIPQVDIEKIDPSISIRFFACDGTCELPLAITPDAWADAEFGGRIKNILLSLTVN